MTVVHIQYPIWIKRYDIVSPCHKIQRTQHKTVHDYSEKFIEYFNLIVVCLPQKLTDQLTKNIGGSLLTIIVVWSFCCKFWSPCYCRRISWLGPVSIPFPWAWGVISCPFLHYRTFLQVLLMRLVSRRGGEGMWSRLLLCWFFGDRRHFDSTRGRNSLHNCFLHLVPLKTMRLSG